jgi:hypothetical protein
MLAMPARCSAKRVEDVTVGLHLDDGTRM